jgi:hypothetical protein
MVVAHRHLHPQHAHNHDDHHLKSSSSPPSPLSEIGIIILRTATNERIIGKNDY